MHDRPRRSRYSREQWQVQRDRFQIDAETPAPVNDHTMPMREPLQRLIKALGIEADTLQRRLMEGWEAMAGQPLCRHIRPGPIDRGVLTVYVTNSTLLSELSRFQGPALLKNIQAAVGSREVHKLRFLIDPDTRATRLSR